MMPIFDIAFPIAMILFPAVFSLFIRTRPASGEAAAARETALARLRRRLFAWTAAALALYGVLLWIGSAGAIDEVAYFMWLAFFPLWFKGAMPLLQAKDVGWQPRPAGRTMRSAALVRRDAMSPMLRLAQVAAWAAWAALALATVALLLRSATPQWWLLSFTLMGAVELVLGARFAQVSSLEPEPLDPAGSRDLQAAYAGLRRLKQWSWCGGTALGMLLFTVVALLLAWNQADNLIMAIWIGAGGGSLLGMAGAVVGVMADLHRARISRRYCELTRQAV